MSATKEMTKEEVTKLVEDNIKHNSNYNARILVEMNERTNEKQSIENQFKEINQLNEIEHLKSPAHTNNFQEKYKNMDHEEARSEYKKLFNKQEEMYIYQTEHNIYDDKALRQSYFDNTQKLDYMERNIIPPTEKYEIQSEVKKELFNPIQRTEKESQSLQEYDQLMQNLYQKKQNGETVDEEDKLEKTSNRVLYDKNKEVINNNKEQFHAINQKDYENKKKKYEQSKQFDQLNQKDLMWKIVQQEGRNAEFLVKDGEETLDARANANDIHRQVATNDTMKTSQNQQQVNSSYNNAYKSLNQSNQVSQTNYHESKEQDQKEQKQENSNRKRGMSL